jgi:hypothetical protein
MVEEKASAHHWRAHWLVNAKDQVTGAGMRAEEHTQAVRTWTMIHRSLAVIAAVFSAVAGAAIFCQAEGGWRILAGVLSVVAATAAAAEVSLGARTTMETHKHGADGFASLRTKWYLLSNDIESSDPPLDFDDVRVRFETLVRERDELSKAVPVPTGWAKKRVRRQRPREIS